MPSCVWIAIGQRARRPRAGYPALRHKKATPAEIAQVALEASAWKPMEPYVMAIAGGA